MRFFRAMPPVYAAICQQLDAAYGYPNPDTKTLRTLPLASELLTDSQGRLYLCVDAEYCDYVLPAELLPQLLASGQVEEITQADYQAALPQP